MAGTGTLPGIRHVFPDLGEGEKRKKGEGEIIKVKDREHHSRPRVSFLFSLPCSASRGQSPPGSGLIRASLFSGGHDRLLKRSRHVIR